MTHRHEAKDIGYTSGYTSTGKFGLSNYYKMFKAKGWRLPIRYFFNAHLFDLMYKTDTHQWCPKAEFPEMPENFVHGGLYMCSWTREVMDVFYYLHTHLGEEFDNYQFVDVGCGKGKVVLIWKRLVNMHNSTQPTMGIDYLTHFINIAKKNQCIIFGDDRAQLFEVADAKTYNYYKNRRKLIIYLYNPFDGTLLEAMLRKIETSQNIIVYNNPIQGEVLARNGYRAIKSLTRRKPDSQVLIFVNR